MQHLQSNADDKLDSMVGSRSNVRRAVHSALFVSAGLTSCNDIITFDNKVTEVRKDVLPICHRHRRRSNSISRDYLHSLLRDNVVAGRPRSTNNNCESVNPVIKQYTQWRPQQLPDLITSCATLSAASTLRLIGCFVGAATCSWYRRMSNTESPLTCGRRCLLHQR